MLFFKSKTEKRLEQIKSITSAFNKNSHKLIAVESKNCCNNDSKLIVMNQYVLLRSILEDMGFEEPMISKYLHYRKLNNE